MLMLIFCVGENTYAIDCQYILEVFPKVNLNQIPHTSSALAGLLNLNGEPIAIVDFCLITSHRQSSSSLHTRIILLSNHESQKEKQVIGIIAEKVIEIIDCEIEKFKDSGLSSKEIPYLAGVLNDSNRTIQLLEVNKFFEFLEKVIT